MATLKDFYDARTSAGYTWGYSSDVNGTVAGESDGIAVSWIRDASGNLFSQNGRAFDIQRRYPLPVEVATTRALDSDFVVSAERNARVSYTIETTTAATGAGDNDSEALVELVIDGVVRHSARNRIVATLTAILGLLGLSLTSNVQRWVLSGYVSAGQTVRLVTSGTGTAALLSVQEVLQ